MAQRKEVTKVGKEQIRKIGTVDTRYFDPEARSKTMVAALAAADGDGRRLVIVDPYTIIVTNFPGFLVYHEWTKDDWCK